MSAKPPQSQGPFRSSPLAPEAAAPIPEWIFPGRTIGVVLVEVGPAPRLVADAIEELCAITITDLDALEGSLPLTLFRELGRPEAEVVRKKLELAGASAELRLFEEGR